MLSAKSTKFNFKSDLVKTIFGIVGFIVACAPCAALAQQQVSIEVEGVVKPHCAFEDRQSQITAGQTAIAFSINPEDQNWAKQAAKIPLALSCNAPFNLAVRSSQGGLKNTEAGTKGIGGTFSNEIAYQLTLNMSTEEASAPLVLACPSRSLADTDSLCAASSGSNAAIGRGAGIGELAITLSDSSGFPIRGQYQDTIVVAVAFQ
jgi:spore coat protein U-like protein